MKFTNEQELYEAFNEEVGKLEECGNYFKEMIRGEFRYEQREVLGKKMYLLGEEHYARAPMDFLHYELVPQIEENPDVWMILREGGVHKFIGEGDDPGNLYLKGLVDLYGLTHADPVGDSLNKALQKYVKKSSGISQLDIDKLLIGMSYNMMSDEMKADGEYLIQAFARDLRVTKARVNRLLDEGPNPNLDFDKDFGRHWNDFQKERLPRLLDNDRTNVIVSVGYNHFPIFMEDKK